MIYFEFIDIKELKNRLSTLFEDVTLTSRDVFDLLNIIRDTFNDKRKLLSDIYFNENSPLKIINTQFLPKGDGDTLSYSETTNFSFSKSSLTVFECVVTSTSVSPFTLTTTDDFVPW